VKTILLRILSGLGAIGLLVLSIFLSEQAFQQVLDFRQLERIPLTKVTHAVGGEVQLRGKADGERRIKSPRTSTECLYYRYMVEREEKDSDGNTSWRTIQDDTKSVDFYLEDETGSALIKGNTDRWAINWSIEQKYRRESGGYRYTEWRIDPGDQVTVFGWLERDPLISVDFTTEGHYQPIVSSFGAQSERSDIAFTALIRLWGGISALIGACYCLVLVLRVHKTLVFLSLISLSGTLLLFHYGYRSVQSDVAEGYERVVQHRERAESLVSARLSALDLYGMNFSAPFYLDSLLFSELDAAEKVQVSAWRRGAVLVRERYMQQISRFPESFVAASYGMDDPPAIALPEQEQAWKNEAMRAFEETRTTASSLWSLLLIALTAGAAWFAFSLIRVKRMQENIPTSKTAGVVFGLAEVKGELLPEEGRDLLEGPLTGESCTWYHYKVEEKRGSGKNQSWHTIQDDLRKQPFLCRDEEGTIRVFPGQAECITKHHESETRGNRRYSERRLSPGDELYILGKAKLDKTSEDSLVFGHEKGSPYIIANIPEEAVMLRKAWSGMALIAVALSVLFFGALLIFGSSGQMSSVDFLKASLIAPVFMLFVVFALMYNDLVFLRERCSRNWANIQVSLKKRADLLPQLEEVIRQYLRHESELQTHLVQLRERRAAAASAREVDGYLEAEHQAISEVLARVEQYPDLEGIDLIAAFNRRLIKLENEVSLIRAGFNDAVMHYQTRIETFPDNLLAGWFGFEPVTALSFEAKAHQVPAVQLRDAQ